MTHFQAYLLTRLDAINDLLLGGIIFGTVILLGLFVSCSFWWDSDENKKVKILGVVASSILIFSATIKTFIPTTKEAFFIYIAPEIVNNKDISKTVKKLSALSGLSFTYLEEVLKQDIREADEAKEVTKDKVK